MPAFQRTSTNPRHLHGSNPMSQRLPTDSQAQAATEQAAHAAQELAFVLGPCVVHANREGEEIPRVNRRMRRVHPDTFQRALIPISRNGVVRIRHVPIDRRANVESDKKCNPSGEEMLPTGIRAAKRYFSQFLVHKRVFLEVASEIPVVVSYFNQPI